MDRSRTANRKGHENHFQHESRQDALLDDKLTEDKLTRLLAFLGQLKRTPEGTAEVQHRIKLFGECKRGDGETSAEFYAKLRHWLDRDMSGNKLPLQSPKAFAVADKRSCAISPDRPVYDCPHCKQFAMQFFAEVPGQPGRTDSFRCCACGSTWEL